MSSNDSFTEYLKIFSIALVTSVMVLFVLGPFMLKLQDTEPPPGAKPSPAAPSAVQAPSPAAAQMTAPNLLGLDLREARDLWRKQGIVLIEESQRVDSAVEPGTILSQNPDGGSTLQSKEIRVVVAALPEKITVPSIIGQQASAATEALVEAGFEVPAPTLESSAQPTGEVLRQQPNAGSRSEKGALVRLVISGEAGGPGPTTAATGPAAQPPEGDETPPGMVQVPRVVGMRLPAATTKLEAAGLVLGSVREKEDEELSGRRVLSQRPGAKSEARKGSAVNLVIVAPD